MCPMSPAPSLVDVVEHLSTSRLLYVGFGSMENFMMDVNWEMLFITLDSGIHVHVHAALHACTYSAWH